MTNKTKMQIAPIFNMIAFSTLVVFSLIACNEPPEKEKTISGTITASPEGVVLFMYSRTKTDYPDYCTFSTDLPSPNDTFIVSIPPGESTGKKEIEGLTAGQKVAWTATAEGKPLNQGSSNFVHVVN